MNQSFLHRPVLIAIFFLVSCTINGQKVQEPAGDATWSKPYQPFRIAGNLYYVGTYDLACYLITTGEGHILINTGLAASASQIKNNIEKLGFRLADIKLLLTTQAHFDHLGAMAAIKQMTGARVWVNAPDAPVAITIQPLWRKNVALLSLLTVVLWLSRSHRPHHTPFC